MKTYRMLLCTVLAALLAVFAGANLWAVHAGGVRGREYQVQLHRAALDIEQVGLEGLDLDRYPAILAVTKAEGTPDAAFLEGDGADCALRVIDGAVYRFDYTVTADRGHDLLVLNVSLSAMAALTLAVLLYLRTRIIHPFARLRDLPFQLSKGNLTTPVPEQKGRFFGRFLWGMDLLRERLEDQKAEELRLQKEKKTLVLSITHDIKTPLSAIKLYAKALSKNLYGDREKQVEIADSISARADDIERYISQITAASTDDFLRLPVEMGEFYLSSVLREIDDYYSDKLALLKIPFALTPCPDCLLSGDRERAVEVLQNLMENAVKYGGGAPIQITCTDEEDCRLVTVSSGGCTLSDAELPHIFDSFWRGANAQQVQGSGLGLYICRQLMGKMGGDIFAAKDGDRLCVTAVFRKA